MSFAAPAQSSPVSRLAHRLAEKPYSLQQGGWVRETEHLRPQTRQKSPICQLQLSRAGIEALLRAADPKRLALHTEATPLSSIHRPGARVQSRTSTDPAGLVHLTTAGTGRKLQKDGSALGSDWRNIMAWVLSFHC